jgi:Fe-S-cluster containining protein
MYLYPYDILRMARRLGMTTEAFLNTHTDAAFRDNPCFPSLMLRMSDKEGRPCPFLAQAGCSLYEDRPFSCRCYPLEPAVSRNPARASLWFLVQHPHCQGHETGRDWTVEEWIQSQDMAERLAMNREWVAVDSLLRGNPWGGRGTASPAFRMAWTACFNLDQFRPFVFGSSFLTRVKVPEERIARARESDTELLLLGYDWVLFFLGNTGPLAGREA